MSDEKPIELKMTIDEPTSAGHYVNFANILHNPAEFVFDFGRIVPGRPDVKIHARILTTPVHAKQFLKALTQNIGLYEQQFGTIPEHAPAAMPAPAPETPTN
ncbi:MAG: DUF3467 domain-containing protein [Thermoanaerobaculia bacterium]